jgi:hypothetical protein
MEIILGSASEKDNIMFILIKKFSFFIIFLVTKTGSLNKSEIKNYRFRKYQIIWVVLGYF